MQQRSLNPVLLLSLTSLNVVSNIREDFIKLLHTITAVFKEDTPYFTC